MLSDIFEMFYARVRARQYMSFLINFIEPKKRVLPIALIDESGKIKVNSDFMDNTEFVTDRYLRNILLNPRTFIYSINDKMEYNYTDLSVHTTDTEKMLEVLNRIRKKEYQTVDILKKKSENT